LTNRLANENSPYLLQHADNPVDWFPWGEAALSKARSEDKPILLSIGYAACHWCHVMAHESFEDEETARLMNAWFVNIKVDREERPDLDNIYMQAVVAVTGQGGWPMTVFLTPEGKPFFGGTYFPPMQRYGMPAFRQVLQSVASAWRDRRDEVDQSAEQIMDHLSRSIQQDIKQEPQSISPSILTEATQQLSNRFDTVWGGFSPAPKFPQPMVIEFLLREYIRIGDQNALRMAELTLEKMAVGGMYDHLGGGFARYSTDERWLVPHFEKMLYDNALLARVYLHAWQITHKPLYRQVVEETLDYILRELTHPEGGFYSSQDADSEGVEGKFYVWSRQEVEALLGEDMLLFSRVYDVTQGGNWEGSNILHLVEPIEVTAGTLGLQVEQVTERVQFARQKLFAARTRRVHPGLDSKVLTAWNGLAMAAFAEAGSILDRQDYLNSASRNAEFIFVQLRTPDGRLMRTWKDGGTSKGSGFLEDYAFLADGLLALYQAGFDERWFKWARELADLVLVHFKDSEMDGFYDTADDHERLITRPKDLEDNATPSGNSRTASVLFQLGLYTGEQAYIRSAEKAMGAMADLLPRYPFGFGEWLGAASLWNGSPLEVALVGTLEDTKKFLKELKTKYRPFMVKASGIPDKPTEIPLLEDRPLVNGQAAAYVCQRFVCLAPVTDPQALASQLART